MCMSEKCNVTQVDTFLFNLNRLWNCLTIDFRKIDRKWIDPSRCVSTWIHNFILLWQRSKSSKDSLLSTWVPFYTWSTSSEYRFFNLWYSLVLCALVCQIQNEEVWTYSSFDAQHHRIYFWDDNSPHSKNNNENKTLMYICC